MGRNNAAACYRELGAEMRKLREAAGMVARHVTSRTGWSPTRISRMEAGKVDISVADLTWYLGSLRVPYDQAVPLIDLCRRAKNHNGYWVTEHGDQVPDAVSSLIYHEATATSATIYEPQLVPGLLQTERYARAMISRQAALTEDDVEVGVQIRLERQRALSRRGRRFEFFVHEHALRLVVGNDDVMSEQMVSLALASSAPNVAVRVVPASSGERSAIGGAFMLFGFEEYAPLVYLDSFVATAFWFEDRAYVAPYSKLVNDLADIARGVEESRSIIAALADEYDRGSIADGLQRVAEEQLQR